MTRRLRSTVGLVLLGIPCPAFAQEASPPPPVAPPSSSTSPPPSPPASPNPAPQSTAPASAAPAPSAQLGRSLVEVTSLRLMLDKGIITQTEYESAVHELSETAGLLAPEEGTVVVGKWATTLYGFVETDAIWDSTRSLNDNAGTPQIARPATPAGDNSRFTFAARNSRIGLRVKPPEIGWGIRTSAQLEMDFLGPQLPVGITQPYQGTEAAYFTNPTFRVRHMNLRVETPVVDFLMGQYWQLFGWQNAYNPNTVEIQGVPGEIFSRTPQLRISKTIKATPVTFEVAIAATRPVQRDAGLPDGQAGVRLALDTWSAVQTTGSTGTQISPLSVAVTGLVRRVRVDQWSANPKVTNDLVLGAIAVDGFLPVIPGTRDEKGNSLALNGEYASGYGFADMYSGFTGGIGFPALPAMGMTPSAPFAANIDNGVVTYDSAGGLHGIEWSTYLVGAQYYLPGLNGKLWISGNYSHIQSNNIDLYGTAAKLTKAYDWWDVNLFVAPVSALRIGAEYANFRTMYADGFHAVNSRAQLSGFFVF